MTAYMKSMANQGSGKYFGVSSGGAVRTSSRLEGNPERDSECQQRVRRGNAAVERQRTRHQPEPGLRRHVCARTVSAIRAGSAISNFTHLGFAMSPAYFSLTTPPAQNAVNPQTGFIPKTQSVSGPGLPTSGLSAGGRNVRAAPRCARRRLSKKAASHKNCVPHSPPTRARAMSTLVRVRAGRLRLSTNTPSPTSNTAINRARWD